jgi:serine/threonine protein kinase
VCMDFMKRLLVKDPNQRMTTADALAHPFITGGLVAPVFPNVPGAVPSSASARGASGPLPSVIAENIIQSMLRFIGADLLTKLILEMVAHTLCPDQTRSLCDEFQALDRANNGALSLQAFSSGLISAPSVSNGLVDITTVFNTIAISRANGHGQLLTFHEYIAAAMIHRIDIEEERVLLIFNNLDPGEFFS